MPEHTDPLRFPLQHHLDALTTRAGWFIEPDALDFVGIVEAFELRAVDGPFGGGCVGTGNDRGCEEHKRCKTHGDSGTRREDHATD